MKRSILLFLLLLLLPIGNAQKAGTPVLFHVGNQTVIINPPGGGGGGGGGGGSPPCIENWQCSAWQPAVCPSSGFQSRVCIDLNNCGTQNNQPDAIQVCTHVPSCSDGIKNGGEDGPDCGGPCEKQCSILEGPQEILDLDLGFEFDAEGFISSGQEGSLSVSVENTGQLPIDDVNIVITPLTTLDNFQPIHPRRTFGWNFPSIVGLAITGLPEDSQLLEWHNFRVITDDLMNVGEVIEDTLEVMPPIIENGFIKFRAEVYSGDRLVASRDVDLPLMNDQLVVLHNIDKDTNELELFVVVNSDESSDDVYVEFNINDGSRTVIVDYFGPYDITAGQSLIIGQEYEYVEDLENKVYDIRAVFYQNGDPITQFDGKLDLT